MEVKISEILAARFNETNRVEQKPIEESFSFVLNKLSDGSLVSRLQHLIGEISDRGKRLARHMDIGDLKEYRKMVTSFINEIVTNSHEFSRENFLDRRGRHRVYGIVRLINKDLDDLAQELLKVEKDHLGILALIEEIEGLLMDILV
ncbi:MAG: YaaR family protein [Firmicutes bacterium]|nr:YaaR family protein [Bacillota bacterium]